MASVLASVVASFVVVAIAVVASDPSSVAVVAVDDDRSSFAWLDYLLGAFSSACLEQGLLC